MKNLFLTIMLFTGNLLVYSQLTCDSSMYLGQTPNVNSNTTLYGVNTSTNPFTYPAIGTISALKYNAMGFHPTTGYIYAMSNNTNNILRINSDGTYVNLGPVTNLPAGVSFNSGEIDSSGNYYVSGADTVNTLYRINLTTLTATAIPLQSTIAISDFAFNPVNNTLYGVDNNTGILIRINPANGAVVPIGTASAGTPFGAMMGSSTGAIYGVSNNGGFYQFNTANGSRVLISGSPSSQGNDGAHCVTAPIAFGADLSITKTNGTATYTPGTTTVYTVVVRNDGPFGVLNANVVDHLPTGIPNTNMSYTAVASSGSATGVTGTQTGAIDDLVSLPVDGTVTYTVTINIPSTFTGNLTNTATVTSPVTSSDTNLSNNTASDTDVPSSCLTGLDSDGDGIGDLCDADADNDGIPNCIENGFNGDPNTAFKSNNNATAFTNAAGPAPINQFRLTNGSTQQGQAWSYGKIDFAESFNITMKVLLSDADGIAVVFHNDPLGTFASGINGQGLGARGIANGLALELDTFANSCTNDVNNGGNCDPDYDHGSIRTTAGTATSGWTKLAGDGQLGDGTVDDGLWHTVVVTWNAGTRNLSYTFDGTAVTNYTFPATGTNAIQNIFGGTTKVRFGFTGSTGGFGGNNSIGFDNPCEIPLYFDTDNDGTPDYLDLDSDNDGCPDAIEGDENVIQSQLNANGSINITANGGVDASGVPNLVNTGGAADTGNDQGQSVGFSQTALLNECDVIPGGDCIKPGVAGTALPTKVGILTKATPSAQWPQNVPNGHIVLDGAEKGFVITHMTTTQRDALVPVEGMMIYNTTENCVQLYRGTTPSVDTGRTGWNCLETACGSGIAQRDVNIGYWGSGGYNFFSNHGSFRSQLENTANYGATGTFKGISGWNWINANTDINATAATFSAAQLKVKYDMIVTGWQEMSAASAAKIKEYTDLGGVVFVLMDSGEGINLNVAFGGGTIGAGVNGNQKARTLNNSITNGIFGTGGGTTIFGANESSRPAVTNIPPGAFITGYLNTSGTNVNTINDSGTEFAAVYITGNQGRAIFVYDEGIFRYSTVSGMVIDTPQEIFIHNLMSYALQKVGFVAQ